MKASKIIKWTLFSLVLACAIAYVVCYALMKDEVVEFTNNVINFLNQPLPIIGVSVLVVGGIVVKILSMSAWGKRRISEVKQELASYKQKIEDDKVAYEEYKSVLNDLFNAKEKEIEDLRALLEQVIKLSPNKKIRELLEKEEKVD